METVDTQLRKQAFQVMAINIDDRIPDNQVRAKAFEVVPLEGYKQFLKDFNKPNLDRDFYRWQYYGEIALTIKKNIRPMFKVLEFSCTNDHLTRAVAFLRQHLDGSQSFRDYRYQDVPMDIVDMLNQFEANMKIKYGQVNQAIRSGENPSLKTHYNKQGELQKWTLPYSRLDDGMNNPFYEKLNVSSIGDILKFTATGSTSL